jgi:hypothetical protein
MRTVLVALLLIPSAIRAWLTAARVGAKLAETHRVVFIVDVEAR